MKGKIILLFALALLALAAIGYLGQRGLRNMIVSIEDASRPNATIAGINEIMQSLSDAESSVRSYIITREEQTLTPFKESAATIQLKLDQLKEVTGRDEQLQRLERLDQLITQKYETLSTLINVRNSQNGDVLARVMEDIDRLKTEAEEESQEDRQDPSVFERLFGEEPSEEDSAATDAAISTRQLDQAISRIGREESAVSRQIMEQELRLTQQDNAIMERIRSVLDEIELSELRLSSSRTESVRETSEKTINTITTVLIITLILFAFLLSVIFNDIRRARKYRENLREAKERAEELARVKEEFLSNMSHEIRTPLSALIGFSEQLEDTPLDEEQSRMLSRVKSSSDHLLRLINDILDYARMESGKMQLEQSGFRPREELENVLALFQAPVARKGLTLTGDVEPGIPQIFRGDSVRFRQIIINLVNNAVKFTEEGSVRVHLKARPADEENQFRVTITVSDTGIGIPENKLDTIFDEFSQADSSTSRKYGGSGLGLSIVHKLALLHDGSVKVESSEGEGTHFHVTLTYYEGSENDLPRETETKSVVLSGIRVLVVDDQPYNLELLETILLHWKMDCTACSSGEEAMEAARNQTFDILLLDIQMPGMSGLELARQLRDEHLIRDNTPIVALTAGTSEKEKQEARAAGMEFFLSKPYTRKQLRATIRSACGLETTETQQESNGDGNGSLKLDGLMELASGDMEFVTNMLTIFRNNFYNDLDKLEEAVRENDKDGVRAAGHKMSPPCRHLGFSDMATRLKVLEKAAEEGGDMENIRRQFSEIQARTSTLMQEIEEKIDELDPNKQRV